MKSVLYSELSTPMRCFYRSYYLAYQNLWYQVKCINSKVCHRWLLFKWQIFHCSLQKIKWQLEFSCRNFQDHTIFLSCLWASLRLEFSRYLHSTCYLEPGQLNPSGKAQKYLKAESSEILEAVTLTLIKYIGVIWTYYSKNIALNEYWNLFTTESVCVHKTESKNGGLGLRFQESFLAFCSCIFQV